MAEKEEDTDTFVEEREELMVSPSGEGNPTLRPAHFLKPSVSSIDEPIFEDLPLSALCSNHNLVDLPLKVSFKGWRHPMRKWKSWVNRMHSLHQSTWKKAGVYEAIISSTYGISINKEIVLGFASRWCPETNSFVFPFGEATITLEDVLISGGYPVVGNPIFSPLETKELIGIDRKLMQGRTEGHRSKSRKPSQQEWTSGFIYGGSEIEHEAFLVLWLSRHVFPKVFNLVCKHVHGIAIHIARGTRVALAPAVLACLYRDLRMLKEAIVASSTRERTSENDDVLLLDLYAPMQLVQIWAYERFPTLCPKPNSLQPGEPRMARWNKVKKLSIKNVSSVIDSAGEYFHWRPYAIFEKSWLDHKFYKEREEWVLVHPEMDEEFESFARILRAGELVGLDCIEQYLPHRVAMQFGMDQDLPGHVARSNETQEIAWKNYTRPITDRKLYIPSRLFESDVTTRYLEWWKQLMFVQKDADKGGVEEGERISKSSGESSQSSEGKKVEFFFPTPPRRKRSKLAKSVGKLKQTLVGSAGDRMTSYEKSFPCTKPQTPSSLAADNGGVKERESHLKQDKVDGNGLSTNDDEGEISICHNAHEIPGLEARISKLEETVARLKKGKISLASGLLKPQLKIQKFRMLSEIN